MINMPDIVKKGAGFLKKAFRPAASHDGMLPDNPEKIRYPGVNASLSDHAAFVIVAKNYIRDHPVPDDHQNTLKQYSHAGKPPIGDGDTAALTNCCYEHFGRTLVSVGFPLYIKQAPLVKDNKHNPAFNALNLWDSVERLLKHHLGDLGDGSVKAGYYLPTNHWYAEKPVPKSLFGKAEAIIEFITRTDVQDPAAFLRGLDHAAGKRNDFQPNAGVSPAPLYTGASGLR